MDMDISPIVVSTGDVDQDKRIRHQMSSGVRYGAAPSVATFFAGRSTETTVLDSAVEGPTITVVVGDQGVGTTQVAARYYDLHDDTGEYILMAWIDGRRDLVTQLVGLAQHVGFGQQWVPRDPGEIVDELFSWLAEAINRPWLIVLDGVDDPEDVSDLVESVRGTGRLLLTSSCRDWPSYAHVIGIDALQPPDAVQLLRAAANRSGDETGAVELAGHLGGYPLALTLAGAACHAGDRSFGEYLALLRSQDVGPHDDGHSTLRERSVDLIWRESLTGASRRAPHASDVLAMLAQLDWRCVDQRELTDGLADTPLAGDIDPALGALQDYGLISLVEGRIAIAHEVIADGACEMGDPAIIDEALIGLFDNTLPRKPAAYMETVYRAAEPLRQFCLHVASRRTVSAGFAGVLDRGVRQLLAQRDCMRVEALAAAEVALNQRINGSAHANTLRARAHLALAYWWTGRTTEAVELQEHVLADSEAALGLDHPTTLAVRDELGSSYVAVGRTGDLVALDERALADSERELGIEHPTTLTVRFNLAGTYGTVGRDDDALILHEKVLNDRARVLGADHPDTLKSRNCVADLHRYAQSRQRAPRFNAS